MTDYKFEILELTMFKRTPPPGDDLATWNFLVKSNLIELQEWLERHSIDYNIVVDDIRVNTSMIKSNIYLTIPNRKHAAHFKLVYQSSIYPKIVKI